MGDGCVYVTVCICRQFVGAKVLHSRFFLLFLCLKCVASPRPRKEFPFCLSLCDLFSVVMFLSLLSSCQCLSPTGPSKTTSLVIDMWERCVNASNLCQIRSHVYDSYDHIIIILLQLLLYIYIYMIYIVVIVIVIVTVIVIVIVVFYCLVLYNYQI